MNWFDNYRQQNQHLFGEDSDFSDTEEDFEPEENEEIEIEEKIQKKFWKKNFWKNFEKKIFWKKNFFVSKYAKKSPQHEKSKKNFFWVKSAFSF